MVDRLSEQELRQMYLGDQLSMREIAKLIGVSQSTIGRWMKKYGIEARTDSESLLVNTLKLSKEELRQMYHDEQMSMFVIAEVIGVSYQTIFNRMKEYGIESRTCSESHLVNTSKPSKEELQRMYWDDQLSMVEIAKNVGVYPDTVRGWMKGYSVKIRTVSEAKTGKCTGENSSQWNGGTSFEPYCNKFNDSFKDAVRERDDYTCQLCGCEQLLGGTKLSIHHIHYDKANCYPDVVTLCCSCNGKVNSNRDHWEQYFGNQLLERELLGWSMQ